MSKSAVRQIGTVWGKPSAYTVTLAADDVGRLADQAGVADDVIRQVAPKLDEQPVWQRSLNGARTVYERTPEQVRSNLVGIACDGMRGKITTYAELYENVLIRFEGATQDEIEALVSAVEKLWQELLDASVSEDPQLKAGAALTCYTVEQVVEYSG